jgi:hypothetical protein
MVSSLQRLKNIEIKKKIMYQKFKLKDIFNSNYVKYSKFKLNMKMINIGLITNPIILCAPKCALATHQWSKLGVE